MSVDKPPLDQIADAAMDAKMREIWGMFQKPWIRTMIREVLPPTPVHTLGCDFIVYPRDNFTEFKIWENGLPPEHLATQYIADFLEDSDPVIVDVGANAGAFFLPVHKKGGSGTRSIVFEPNPVMQHRLLTNIALNDIQNDVTLFTCAISDTPGRARLQFPRNGNLGQGRIDVAYKQKHASEGVEVAVRPLVDCLVEAGVSHIDFLKVDVEGLEDRVIVPLLQGDPALHPHLIYFEVAHDGVWSLPLLQTLEDAGYTRLHDFDNNALFQRKVQP
jgi:FkbM family methyltransferase